MSTLPTVPNFVANDSSLTKLQQLAACVVFLCLPDSNISNPLPAWHYYSNVVQNFSANTVTTVNFQNHPLDTDSTYTSTGIATIHTQGIYKVQTNVQYNATATNQLFKVYFKFTAGASNPNHTSGTVITFGGGSIGTGTISTDNPAQTAMAYTPVVCYPGDTIQVLADADAALSTSISSYPQFSGRWVQLQSTP